jgi:cell division protein FtsB
MTLKRVTANSIQAKLDKLAARKLDLEREIPKLEQPLTIALAAYDEVKEDIADLTEELAALVETLAEERARREARAAAVNPPP